MGLSLVNAALASVSNSVMCNIYRCYLVLDVTKIECNYVHICIAVFSLKAVTCRLQITSVCNSMEKSLEILELINVYMGHLVLSLMIRTRVPFIEYRILVREVISNT